MTMTNEALASKRAAVEAATEKLEHMKAKWLKANRVAEVAHDAAEFERGEKVRMLELGGPRPGPGHKPPPTAREVAESEANSKLATARYQLATAKIEFNNAAADLLAAENRILNRWRHQRALEILELQRIDAAPELIAEKLAELRVLTPPDTCVRLDQRFTVSALVDSLLHDRRDAINVRVDELRGEIDTGTYEKRRAEVLAQAENDSVSPLEVA
jgi:hypothetical protein